LAAAVGVVRIAPERSTIEENQTMSAAAPSNHDNAAQDPIEEVTKYAPVVIPVAGGILIFLLAFIAVFMA